MDIERVIETIAAKELNEAVEILASDLERFFDKKLLPMIIEEIDNAVTAWAQAWLLHHTKPKSNAAVAETLSISGGKNNMPTFTINTTDGLADVQFVDTDNDKVEGPLDSVTQAPVVPSFTSDNTSVLTVGVASEDPNQPGHWTAPLAEVGAGTANVAPAPLTNSDGSPVLETVGPNTGQPFETAAAVAVTVNPGAPAGEVFSITG